MIDPKMVELQQYKDFPHVNKVVTEMREAGRELERLVVEMENRYQQFKDAGVKTFSCIIRNLQIRCLIPFV